MPGIFGHEISELSKVMNYRLFRQGVISSNVANIDTPGYRAREATFEEELDSRLRMETTAGTHIPSAGDSGMGFKIAEDPYSRIGNDSNTVDLDRERANFVDNAVRYEATLRFINGSVRNMLDAIKGTNQ